MSAQRVRALITLVLMVAAFAGAQAWRPTVRLADTRPKVNLETMFPTELGDWRLDERMPVQLVSPDTQALLDELYNQTLSRTYFNRASGERIMLSVAYGGDQSDATRAHRPEVCYPAQGFQILEQRKHDIRLNGRHLPVRQLVSKLGARIEPITYWVMVGDRVATSGTEQKLAQLTYSTQGLVPDGMLVRASSIEPDAEKAYAVHQSFLAALESAIPPEQRDYVFGR